MKAGLTGHLVIRNGDAYDYCWREAVASIIDVVDEFIILEAYSDKDDTYEHCLTLKEKYHPKLRVIRGEWDGNEPRGHEYLRLSRLTNQCIDACETKFNICLQGDEAYHEAGLEALRVIAHEEVQWDDPPMACVVRFIHLVGNPWTHFPFLYSCGIRMARTDSTWRSAVDAAGYKFTDFQDNSVIWLEHPVCFHYGKLGDPMKKLMKQSDFELLFKAKGFPDPRVKEMVDRGDGMSYAYLFQDAKDKGLFLPYNGTHPAVMADWLESHKDCWETFTE